MPWRFKARVPPPCRRMAKLRRRKQLQMSLKRPQSPREASAHVLEGYAAVMLSIIYLVRHIWSRPPAGYPPPPPPPHGMVQVGVQGQGRGMPLLPHH